MPERVRETEELREEVALIVRPRRRRVAEETQRRAVEIVRADRLVLQRHVGARERQLESGDARVRAGFGDELCVGRPAAAGDLAEEQRSAGARPERQRQLKIETEHGCR